MIPAKSTFLNRRTFLKGSSFIAMSSLLGNAPLQAAKDPLPASTHTWFGDVKPQIYNYDVDVRIALPQALPAAGLYFAAIQTNFEKHDEWGHGGLQWVDGVKKINWGGGSETGYGKTYDNEESKILQDFEWKPNNWYRYRVWRIEKDQTGYWRWLFAIQDYSNGKDLQIGSLRTVSEWISGAVVWLETGWGASGVQCTTEKATVEWRNPLYRCTTPGVFTPGSATADYNGSCGSDNSTNQVLTSSAPYTWRQETNSKRKTAAGAKLWQV